MDYDIIADTEQAFIDIIEVVDNYFKILAEVDREVLSVNRSSLLLDVLDYINNFDDEKVSKEISVLSWGIEQFSRYGRFCITQQHRLGCTQEHVKLGDLICVFYKGNVPFLLRLKIFGYELLKPTYVYNIMNSEVL